MWSVAGRFLPYLSKTQHEKALHIYVGFGRACNRHDDGLVCLDVFRRSRCRRLFKLQASNGQASATSSRFATSGRVVAGVKKIDRSPASISTHRRLLLQFFLVLPLDSVYMVIFSRAFRTPASRCTINLQGANVPAGQHFFMTASILRQ